MERDQAAVVQLSKIRLREPLRAAIERAAEARGVSMNQEIAARLENSFEEECDFGGPEMLAIVRLMTGAFLRGGENASRAKFGEVRPAADWQADPWCYGQAIRAVGRVLGEMRPPGEEVPPALPDLETIRDPEQRRKVEQQLTVLMGMAGAAAGNAELNEAGLSRRQKSRRDQG